MLAVLGMMCAPIACSKSKPKSAQKNSANGGVPTQQTPERQALAQAVSASGGRSVEGRETPLLCQLAHDQAVYMAEAQTVNHDNLDDEWSTVEEAGGYELQELIASAAGGNLQAAASSCVQQWRNSQDYGAPMQSRWDNFCYDMVRGNDGQYYCTGMVANGLH